MATYSISVQAAGCLPDSDTYPYTVEGLDQAVSAVMDEIGDDRDDWSADDIRTALADGIASFDLGGTYILEAIEV